MYTETNNTFFSRKRTNSILAVAFIFVLSVFTVGYDSTAKAAAADETVAQVDIAITDEEADSLIFMREEEKLARDVYLTLYDVWGTAVFNDIASSEQIHMDAILTLIDQYGLVDPAAGNAVGVFINPYLQALYNQLIATGNQSLVNALTVGATIEEIDIIDLDEYIAATTNQAIIEVYTSLLAGSENHLRAFVPLLEQLTGETYIPQYLSQAQYDAIMSADGSGQQGGGNGNGKKGNH
jgi:hypothetical protein